MFGVDICFWAGLSFYGYLKKNANAQVPAAVETAGSRKVISCAGFHSFFVESLEFVS
jgi:hypothetical protein